MVARTAFHQLNYSVLALAGTVAAMVFLYLLPPVLTVVRFYASSRRGDVYPDDAGFGPAALAGPRRRMERADPSALTGGVADAIARP